MFNTELAKYRPKNIEYVILHELTHLIEHTHNQIFVSSMEKYMPNWRQYRDELNMDDFEPLVTTSLTQEDEGEFSLRPKTLSEYIGQEKAKGNLEVFIQAAKMRGEPLDHVLLHGPPGL